MIMLVRKTVLRLSPLEGVLITRNHKKEGNKKPLKQSISKFVLICIPLPKIARNPPFRQH